MASIAIVFAVITAESESQPSMDNLGLFALINAGPGLDPIRLALAVALAQWLIFLVPLFIAITWLRGDHVERLSLLHMLLAVAIALGIAQFVAYVWPQPRPITLHLGSQYLAHDAGPGLPSSYVTLFWTLGLSAWATRRFAAWCLPLLVTGLLVGWSRVFLGVHFPLDILAAMPVAMVGTAAARVLQTPLLPVTVRVLYLYDLVELALRRALTSSASVSDDSDPARPAVRRRRDEFGRIDRS